MKITEKCISCHKKRVLLICKNLDVETKEKVMNQINNLFSNLDKNSCTIEIAYQRNQVIKNIAKGQTLMDDFRIESMKVAEKLYPNLEQHLNQITNDKKRFCKAAMIALAGNTIEFGSADHKIKISEIKDHIYQTLNEKLVLDDSHKIYNIVKKFKKSSRILYVVDNTAELVFDKLFIKELINYAPVTIATLSEPVQDDACLDDIKYLGLDKLPNCKIVVKGNCIGALLKRTTLEFQEEFSKANLVIAKGMAGYESLSEYPNKIKDKVVFILKAKCKPVAESVSNFFGLNKPLNVGANIIKLTSYN